MNTDASRYRVTVAGPVAEGVLATLRARFDLESVRPGDDGTELVVAGVDQAAQRALLTLLWDTGHVVRSVTP
ncbi:hypothetical protein DMA12_00920 [Amycolatopsis balhimycina DSM 5908]|uniref:Uncharacterized protein n=1 Tax=Amycolatopsis balhimycina DSM 5908 TaxID=1081091 RepID=A0A428X632_AMYBA|nr:hypothetical protein [Amycolatopsis balhimycina]RSM50749.1 hypothetical protein DMA12_00920 [Amycolatopsis balhimycina DSM 5908]